MTTPYTFQLDGKVALVTGAAQGIGRACALALAHAGADLILGLREKASGEALAEEIRQIGRAALPVQMNVANMQEIADAVREGGTHFKRIDILVNNAGIGTPNPAEQVSEKDFDESVFKNGSAHLGYPVELGHDPKKLCDRLDRPRMGLA